MRSARISKNHYIALLNFICLHLRLAIDYQRMVCAYRSHGIYPYTKMNRRIHFKRHLIWSEYQNYGGNEARLFCNCFMVIVPIGRSSLIPGPFMLLGLGKILFFPGSMTNLVANELGIPKVMWKISKEEQY